MKLRALTVWIDTAELDFSAFLVVMMKVMVCGDDDYGGGGGDGDDAIFIE